VGNAHEFKNGRELSAWLGLVPRQHSSGGRNVLLGISKRGDCFLHTLLIHGARSAVRVVERRKDPCGVAISRLKARRGPNVAAVALANRNARVLWELLRRGEDQNLAAGGRGPP
jgi:transposase